jgi:hypothetical protein
MLEGIVIGTVNVFPKPSFAGMLLMAGLSTNINGGSRV